MAHVASRANTRERLPDEVVVEILLRVPDVPDLFRCAVTCKRWQRIMGDPSFLLRR